MKQIGILYGFRKSRWIGYKTDQLLNLLDSVFGPKGYSAKKVGIMDVKIKIKNNRLYIRDAITGENLKNLSALYIANWRINPEIAMAICTYLNRHGIPVINPEISRYLPLTKLGEFVLMSDKDIPLPDSVFMRHKHIRRALKKGKLPFSFPFIAKVINGSMGSDNWLIKSEQDLIDAMEAVPDGSFVLQQFIPNEFDYRILVFGGKPRLAIKRSRVSDDTHVNNTSKGGEGRLIDLKDMDKLILDLAVKAAEAVGRLELGGVDIIIDSNTGKPYVLEVNKSPQIETGSNIDKKLEVFSDFVMEKINESK
ncbi:ATP-grasp domain-containing protein [Candidatus Saccharibacteria bacterium]|nr:ATP-grasp domain-containing protein [Candidatus Saccharibacteria bacterium]